MSDLLPRAVAALSDMLKYAEPCGHSPPDECCSNCEAQHVIREYEQRQRIPLHSIGPSGVGGYAQRELSESDVRRLLGPAKREAER